MKFATLLRLVKLSLSVIPFQLFGAFHFISDYLTSWKVPFQSHWKWNCWSVPVSDPRLGNILPTGAMSDDVTEYWNVIG